MAWARRLALVAILPMVAATMALGLTSDHLQRPLAAALYWSYLTAASMAVGLPVVAPPAGEPVRAASRGLRAGLGAVVAVVQRPAAVRVGVLAEAPCCVDLLPVPGLPHGATGRPGGAHPDGGAGDRPCRGLRAVGVALTRDRGRRPIVRMRPRVPRERAADRIDPELVEWAGNVETYGALAVTLGVLIVYVLRLSGSHPAATARADRRRRDVAAVPPGVLRVHFSRLVLEASPQTLDVMQWGIVATRILLPLGFLVGPLAGRDLRRRVAGTAARAARHPALAGAMARRHGRRARRSAPPVGYSETESPGRFRQADGSELTAPPPDRTDVATRRSRRKAGRGDGHRRGADRGSGAGARGGCGNTARRGERAPRGRAPCLARADRRGREAERHRIERDLHDSAQQRLLALRIHLTLAGEQLEHPEDRAGPQRLDDDLELAIQELRGVARGPPAAARPYGVGQESRRSPMPVRCVDMRDAGLTRHPRGSS